MDTLCTALEEIRATIDQLRQDPKTKRKFPNSLWDSIIRLTKNYSLDDICHQLNINPIYLRKKIRQSKKDTIEFQEVSLAPPPLTPDNVVRIELNSKSGLKAMIQGPVSCLDCLHKLFGG